MELPTDEKETQTRATRIWYERFERKRAEASGQLRRPINLARIALLVLAGVMVLVGIRLRGDKIAQVMAPPTSEVNWPALLSRELVLDDSTGALFFPLWEAWRRDAARIQVERGGLVTRLEELSLEHSQYNMEQDRLMASIAALDSKQWRARQDLLERTRERLGLWQASRLRVLLEESWSITL